MRNSKLVLIAMSLTACGSPSGPAAGGGAVLAPNVNVDYTNTSAMYLAPQGTSVSALDLLFNHIDSNLFHFSAYADGGDSNGLFTLGTNGSLAAVSLTQGAGGNSSSIIDTTGFTILQTTGIVDANGDPCGLVAIAKADSSTHCINAQVSFAKDFYKAVQTDSTGTFIFYTNGAALNKLDMTNPESPVTTILAGGTNGTNVAGFAVNPAGDVAVNVEGGGAENAQLSIIPAGSTTLQEFGTTAEFGSVLPVPGGNSFYMNVSGDSGMCGGAYCKINKAGAVFSAAAAGIVLPMCLPGAGCFSANVGTTMVLAAAPAPGLNWFFTSAGTLVMKAGQSCPGGQTCIAWTGTITGTLSEITGLAGGASTIIVEGQDSSGNTGLYRYNIAGSTFQTLMAPGNFAISSFSVDSSDNVTVSATRASDGAIIMASILAGTTIVDVASSSLSATVAQIVNVH